MTLEQNIQSITGQFVMQLAQAMTLNQQLVEELNKLKAEQEAGQAAKVPTKATLKAVPNNASICSNDESDSPN